MSSYRVKVKYTLLISNKVGSRITLYKFINTFSKYLDVLILRSQNMPILTILLAGSIKCIVKLNYYIARNV